MDLKNAAPAIVRGRPLRILRLAAIYAALFALLYFALRNAPLAIIWSILKQLRPAQIGILILFNAVVVVSNSLRWWTIVRSENRGVPFLPLIGYRLSAFGLSYFTPGVQVGGEPLQVLYLQRNHGLSLARATSAVIMDKLIELLGNFLLVCAGLAAIFRLGLSEVFGNLAIAAVIPVVVLMAWPAAHIVLLYHRRYPLSRLLHLARGLIGKPRWIRLIMISERMASTFTRRRLAWLLASLGFSLAAITGMAVEYSLFAAFLSVPLTIAQVLVALTAGVLAFLLPLPGGLGALEASQVLALGAFGQPAAVAISIALLMRGRDLVNGGLGLLLAGRGFR